MKVKIEAEVELTAAVGRYEPADLRAALAAWFKAQHVKVLALLVQERGSKFTFQPYCGGCEWRGICPGRGSKQLCPF